MRTFNGKEEKEEVKRKEQNKKKTMSWVGMRFGAGKVADATR